MEFEFIKSLHIIFVITWFAGLFYLPRLMIYTAEAHEANSEVEKNILIPKLLLMQKRLLYGITWPSAIITLILGLRLLMIYPLANWLILKLCFVALLYLYHFSLQKIYSQQSINMFKYSSKQLRIWNEVPTVVVFAVVFLVIFKKWQAIFWGLFCPVALFAIVLIVMQLSKKQREQKH